MRTTGPPHLPFMTIACPFQPPTKKPREWAPRIWQGCSFPAWARLLVRNRFAVSPPHWYIAAVVTAVSAVHSVIRFFEEAFYHGVRAAEEVLSARGVEFASVL